MDSIWGVEYDFVLVLLLQFFEYSREYLYKHAWEHLEAARSEKSEGEVCVLRLGVTERPDYY